MEERMAAVAPLKIYSGPERRRQTRLTASRPVRVAGVDAGGRAFDVKAETDDISAGGFYVRLPVSVMPGSRLAANILLPKTSGPLGRDIHLAAHGRVLRSEDLGDGMNGVAVKLDRHLFL